MNHVRSWATPLVAGTALLTGVTGVLMFFHLRGGLTEPLHEWSGWLLVAAVALHLVVNWRPLLHALQRRRALAVVGAFAAVTLLALLPLGGQHRPPHLRATDALLDAPLSAVAGVAQRTPDDLVSALADQGLRVDGPAGTLRTIAAQNGRAPQELLAVILGGERAGPSRGP